MRVLIVGLGSIGKKHIRALLTLVPEAEIFALRSDENKPTSDFSSVKSIYGLEEIKDVNLDFVIISNPTSEHKKKIEELTNLSVPLFIEKPLHFSLDIKETVDLVLKRKILSYVACNLRFLDCLVYISKNISSKKINEVNVYCGSYLPNWRPNTDYTESYSAKKELGGGVHLDLIHELDYLYWLFGKPNQVYRFFRHNSSLLINSFDYAGYFIDYDGFSVNVALNYFRRDPKRSVEFVFEDETWVVDLLSNTVTSTTNCLFISEQKMSDTYEAQMKYFINCVSERNTTTFNTVEDAYNVLQICLEK